MKTAAPKKMLRLAVLCMSMARICDRVFFTRRIITVKKSFISGVSKALVAILK